MNVTSTLSQANFGVPTKKVELDVRKKRKSFEEISSNLVNYGQAASTVLEMQQLTWYLTDMGYLVCGDNKKVDLPNILVRLTMDDNLNLQWLIKQSMRKHWKDFGTPVCITRNELDHIKTLVLLQELPPRPAVLPL
ncbi:MAG: hypothetical protein HZB09_00790 [Candidatus Yonathbacteria bacterium]|nr:hypothetical protein [Candidatus Yonathbacteria bacterium]